MDRIPGLSLDLLRVFRAAASHLSFTRAASDLFVTQSAISRAITLEDQLRGTDDAIAVGWPPSGGGVPSRLIPTSDEVET